MNLTGHWKGKYTYGRGYPVQVIGKSEKFEFDITDIDGNFTGTCIDEIVKSIPGNESFIEGDFKNTDISFLKKYKYQVVIDDSNNKIPADDIKSEGVHYTGRLFKRLFSRKPFFRGTWTITSSFRNKETKKTHVFTVEGSWFMERSEKAEIQ